ncbi:hypothetical protein OE88DRAFT_1714576 [Heliocybe sulcata]|uniref:Protein transport protein SFT2 n=1 Tax=Heliocybe sulcata TaxID=5364 RepID=A0A5C3MQ48_9AGAM|nr:hypothetical protein OE88DRAFT_1714576 [Heliocybe sulcata]
MWYWPGRRKPEENFRANLSQFRWAGGSTDDSQTQRAPSANPFSSFYNAIGGGYVPLRSSERSNEEAYFALSRWERLLGFGACLLGEALRKLAPPLMYPMISFSVLIGPWNHVKHFRSKERLPFTLAYFSSLGLTLHFSLGHSDTMIPPGQTDALLCLQNPDFLRSLLKRFSNTGHTYRTGVQYSIAEDVLAQLH